jgi:hypothetical protein
MYFGFAHVCLALALARLAIDPGTAGGFFLHPRMAALVHLVTLGWISGSILGAFYIAGPLVLRMPLRTGWADQAAFVAFAIGVLGVSAGFWTGDYASVSAFAMLALAAVLHVAQRAWRGLAGARAPGAVKLHVALAFANILAAGLLGMLIGLNRIYGWLPWSPLHAAYAHAHLAAIGWAVMMVAGIGYRLVPMVLPAAMPQGSSLAASAVLLQIGAMSIAAAMLGGSAWGIVAGALLVLAGLASFVARLLGMLKRRLPPPAALPRPDWPTRQTAVAFVCLLLTMASGLLLLTPAAADWHVPLRWIYGTLGLVGFLSQIVIGIQGRLLPMHGWYAAFEARGLDPPQRSAHELGSVPLARAIFWSWALGVPALAGGLALGSSPAIAAGSAMLLAGVVLNAVRAVIIARRVRLS